MGLPAIPTVNPEKAILVALNLALSQENEAAKKANAVTKKKKRRPSY